MSLGLEVYRSDGSIQMALADRLTRVAGIVTISAAGSVTVDSTYGTPWGVLIPNSNGPYQPPTFSGNTISWTVTSGILVYGVY